MIIDETARTMKRRYGKLRRKSKKPAGFMQQAFL
jgi:hypothetical protein